MAPCSFSRRACRWILGAALALVLGWPAVARAQTYTDLHDFNSSAGDPSGFIAGRLAQGRDGNFYAESEAGGPSNLGTVFKLTPRGTPTIIHSFDFTDGAIPQGGITLGADGNFYGNATSGGTAFDGTVFKVAPSGVLTVLHSFTNAGDGVVPVEALVLSTNGNFYGATFSNPATIYQITPSGTFSTIHTLTSNEGENGGQLSLGSDGNLYGGTNAGGANSNGTAFTITTAGVLTVLHNFDNTDGADASFGMVQSANGIFYGATSTGGSSNAGTIYSLTSTGAFTLLHNLNGTTDGKGPSGPLLLASDGNLYGVTGNGGIANCGTIFKLTPGGVYGVVFKFDTTHGCAPLEQVIQGTNGLLYGLADAGGAHSSGVFYSLDLHLPAFTGLVSPAGKQGAHLGILGQGFSGSSLVKFDGVPATFFALTGSTFISAVIPPSALTGKVTVTTGTTTLTSSLVFKVLPTTTSFTPTSGPVGTPVTIAGTGLTQATKVSFNGTSATFAVNSDTQITATVPTGATTGKIRVTTKGGSASSTSTFTVD